MRTLITSLMTFAVFGLSGMPHAGLAQTYPAKPVTVVVPFPAGGPE